MLRPFLLLVLLSGAAVAQRGPEPLNNGGLPAASPDGKRIAFISNRDGTNDIYVVNADGTGLVRVTNNADREGAPAWTADSREVLFSTGDRTTAKLFAIAPGGAARELASVAGQGPVLSPDRSLLAYSAGQFPALSLTVSRVDGSGPRALTDGKSAVFNGVWSPDGKRLAYATMANDAERRLTVWVANADGSSAKPAGDIPATEGSPQWPAWSPDGRRLAVQVGKYDRTDRTKNTAHIWLIDLATGATTKVAPHDRAYLDETPTWIDASTIAFQSDRGGRMEVWVMKADGTAARQLTK